MSTFIPNPLAAEIAKVLARPAVDDAAEAALEAAKRLVPVDTGALQESIHIEDNPDGEGKRIVVETDYWAFVEFGTSTQAAEPFMRPVIDDIGLHR